MRFTTVQKQQDQIQKNRTFRIVSKSPNLLQIFYICEGGFILSSRSLQIKAIKQKIERLQAQLDYLKKIDEIEEKQEIDLTIDKGNTRTGK